jgi:hypothetical protein
VKVIQLSSSHVFVVASDLLQSFSALSTGAKLDERKIAIVPVRKRILVGAK